MGITREGRLLITRDLSHTPCIGLESDMLDACVDECLAQGYKGVFGMEPFGFRERDLDSLRRLPHLETAWLPDLPLDSIDGLYALPGLRYLGIGPKRPAIDFSRFPELETVVWHPRAKDHGVAALEGLRLLHVWRFAPKDKSFGSLELPASLYELGVFWSNPPDLSGMRPIPGLRRLVIERCRNLQDISAIPELFPALEHLVVAACGKVTAEQGEQVVARLPALRHAVAGNRRLK
jgi:hypothetical protein